MGADSSVSVAISAISAPMGIVCPASTKMSVSTPSTGDGISMLTLSVTTSASGSYFSTSVADLLEPPLDDGLGDRFPDVWVV